MITPYRKGADDPTKEAITSTLTQGVRVVVPGTGYQAFVAKINEGDDAYQWGAILFVYSVSPESLVKSIERAGKQREEEND